MRSPLEQNYYELLEVPRDATRAEIDRAYDRARAYFGPGSIAVYSLSTADELKAVLDRIDEAWLVLSDDAARSEYEQRVGPPTPDERPLHREVRLAREREAQKEKEHRETAAREAAAREQQAKELQARQQQEEERAERERLAREQAERERHEAERERQEQEAAAVAAALAAVVSRPETVSAPSTLPGASTPEPIASPPAPEPEPVAPPPAPPRPVAPAPALRAPPKPLELPADGPINGELLKRMREHLGLTLLDMSDRTKIGKTHLDNIERENFAALPAQVYLRGFLISIARELRVDPVRVAKAYLDAYAHAKAKGLFKPAGKG